MTTDPRPTAPSGGGRHPRRTARPSPAATARTGGRKLLALLSSGAIAVSGLVATTTGPAGAVTDANPSFEIIASDLEFILDQIKISESHAAGGNLLCADPLDTSGTCVPHPQLPWGVRTVDGSYNNLIPGRSHFGSADQAFPRMLEPPMLRAGQPVPESPDPDNPIWPGPPGGTPTHYNQTSGFVYDSQPRTISNLIVDQTDANPAAVAVAEKVEGSETGDDGRIFIPNESPDEGLSAPFNTWFIFFGQFFDHGLDLVNKGGSGTVMVPLQEDDPLYDPNSNANFLLLTRATNEPGPDGVLGTADDVRDHTNQTTPFVDQNQTYTSHPSHQVFLREYTPDGDGTGRLLDGADGGLATWDDVKAQAQTVLGVQLSDMDVLNVPLLRTDPYGNFVPGPSGNVQYATPGGFVEADGGPVPADALRTNHAFLDDIAHAAAPTPNNSHDVELLGSHFITGDGRGNENIALTAVHHVFHAEHNRLAAHVEDVLDANPALKERYENDVNPGATKWSYGQRLFQAARFVTEMEYQHLVFEEFARFIQPEIDVAPLNESTYHTDIDAAIVAEFAHVVYRFGHSQLTETINRDGFDAEDIPLLDGFLNPAAFTMNGVLTPERAAGAIANGTVRQPGNAIDEFVTETLRNELLGLPLDLATINMARGRDTGVPPLQTARQTFYDATGDIELKPYASWADFGENMKNPESLVNFVAAYGTHPSITGVTTVEGKRAAAQALLGTEDPFLTSPAATSGLNTVDFWMGGLAEAGIPFGGMLGTTFNFVFERQLENLQNGDRFYYLNRNIGLNLFHQLEANSFSAIIQRTTDATMLPAEVFTAPDIFFEVGDGNPLFRNECTADAADLNTYPQGNRWRFYGGEHVSMHGTAGNDCLRGGIGDDSLWGYGGDDHITGGPGANSVVGGDGNDILYGLSGEDNIKGGKGNDAIHAGPGPDLVLGGSGKDFILHGSDSTQSFAGLGDDFVMGGAAHDVIAGNEGDDWLEGGGGADLVQGDNSNGFQNDPNGGHDVLIGGPGNDDHDSEGGDDIMVAGPGTDRFEGMLGFDWVTHRGYGLAANADMDNTVFQPPDQANFRDRYDLVEGLSGWDNDDILRGVGRSDENDGVGHELSDDQLDRVAGLRELLGGGANPPYAAPFMTANTTNNILLGGGGSDLIEGRGGDDFIDGSAWLDVYIEWRPEGGSAVERRDSMQPFMARVFNRTIDPGDLHIVREVVVADEADDVINTAQFSDVYANYSVAELGGGYLRVTHNVEGNLSDGSDVLRNVQRLQFADQAIDLTGSNTPAEGQPAITNLPATQGLELGVDLTGISDVDGIDPSTWRYEWQAESEPDVWAPVATGADQATFTPGPDEVGLRLRVVVSFNDNDGVLETVTSDPTASVVGDGVPTPVVTVAPGELGFGSVIVGQPQTLDVTVANAADSPAALEVGEVTLSDGTVGFGFVSQCTGPVAAGGSCTVSVTFAPTVVGAREADLSITHNGASAPVVVGLGGTGVAAPPPPPSPTVSVQGGTNFGNRRVGDVREQTVRLRNEGPGVLTVGSVQVTGANFSLGQNTCTGNIAVRARCEITVVFTPAGAAGARTGTVSVHSNAVGSPTTVTVTGNVR